MCTKSGKGREHLTPIGPVITDNYTEVILPIIGEKISLIKKKKKENAHAAQLLFLHYKNLHWDTFSSPPTP